MTVVTGVRESCRPPVTPAAPLVNDIELNEHGVGSVSRKHD